MSRRARIEFFLFPGSIPILFPGNITVGDTVCLRVGQSVDIYCGATGTEPITYEWMIQPNPEVISTDESYSVTDPGTYTCSATNPIGNVTGSSLVLGE